MSSGHNDPKLLYAVEGINAYHITNGKEQSLTPSGPQTLSLLMVPTSSGFVEPSGSGSDGEEDFYLHLHLPPEEDVDTFETILAQCTAFLERAAPPQPPRPSEKAQAKAREAAGEQLPAYNPADYNPGEGYVQGSHSSHTGGRIVLIDEEDGSVLGELTDSYQVVEDSKIKPGSKEPVEIALPTDGGQNISVQPVSQPWAEMDMHPAYKKSTIVNSASKASRLIVTTSDVVSRTLQSQADNFTKNTKPLAKPVTFAPTTHAHIRRINNFSNKAATFSATTVGTIGNMAQNLGATVTRRKDGRARGYDKDGNAIDTYKPGVLNKSLMAFNTVVDGIEQAGRNLLTGTSSSVTTVVGHRWGEEAGELSRNLGGGVKNVGLVYIDVTGVSRRAILKSVAKGMVVGKVKGGGEIIVGGTDNKPNFETREGNGQGSHSTYGDNVSVASGYDPNGKKPAKGHY
ncbi:Senescence/spartin-associated, C-terminal [Fusarium oxysporum f. sp. vasinfectum]|nr:Senescence/spartin-associated, C-terminal [Fusarium oxysporum f. sp. vasinfectum]